MASLTVRSPNLTISGDLASGKSTVAKKVAARLGIRRLTIGDVYRRLADQRGLTAVEMAHYVESHPEIDEELDRLQADLASGEEPVVVDSRLGWLFVAGAFKVHLVVDPTVAAARALARPATATEAYADLDAAAAGLSERAESERRRFLELYGVDKDRLRHYDLVCDTTRADPAVIVDLVVDAYHAWQPGQEVQLFIAPQRVSIGPDLVDADPRGKVAVAYARPRFGALSGRETLRQALRDDSDGVPAVLVAEEDEEVRPGLSAREYVSKLPGR